MLQRVLWPVTDPVPVDKTGVGPPDRGHYVVVSRLPPLLDPT